MGVHIDRREFLQSAALFSFLDPTSKPVAAPKATQADGIIRLESFDYTAVRLLPSRFLDQYVTTREFYFGLNDDDLLHGFRLEAELPAPGKGLDGWCRKDTAVVFGQWLSGMARMAKATSDRDMGEKAARLMQGWGKAFRARLHAGGHYAFDKMVCGLLDIHLYTQHPDALPLLKQLTEVARKQLSRTRQLASAEDPQASAGGCLEWYTLSENLYRAFLATDDSIYKEFGDVWRYDAYWSKFLNTSAPEPLRVHAYSHVNSFSSAVLTYQASGDPRYLQMARHAYEFICRSQMFAAGGYGPGERLVGYNGELGRALELHADTAEIGCGTWSGFKLSRYLMNHTGEARYGAWIERLLYNGIGAALPMAGDGDTFYYADYRIGSGTKYYLWDHWPCCAGTHIQDVADYHNILYFRDASGLYVNLFVPSEVTWQQADQRVRLTLRTTYPESELVQFGITTEKPVKAAIRFRVPEWASTVLVSVNGALVPVEARASTWATLERTWQDGDVVEIRIPMSLRAEAVDREHPDRVAILYGPVVLVEDLRFNLGLHMPSGRHGSEELTARFQASERPLHFRVTDPPGQVVHSGAFYPYWEAAKDLPYRMYHDFSTTGT